MLMLLFYINVATLMTLVSMRPKINRAGLALGAGLLLAVPIACGAATATTTISSVVSPVISLLTTNGMVNVDATPTGSGVQTIAKT